LQFHAAAATVQQGAEARQSPPRVPRFRPSSQTATRRPVSLTGSG